MQKGVIYLVQPAELVGTHRYKVGCSKKPNLDRCKKGYKKGTRFIAIMECKYPLVIESELKKAFNKKFELIAGREYYKGNESDMRDEFLKIACNFENTHVVVDNKNGDNCIGWCMDCYYNQFYGISKLCSYHSGCSMDLPTINPNKKCENCFLEYTTSGRLFCNKHYLKKFPNSKECEHCDEDHKNILIEQNEIYEQMCNSCQKWLKNNKKYYSCDMCHGLARSGDYWCAGCSCPYCDKVWQDCDCVCDNCGKKSCICDGDIKKITDSDPDDEISDSNINNINDELSKLKKAECISALPKIKNIIIRYLLKYRIVNCCLFGSILLYEQLDKLEYKPKLKLGYMLTNNKFAHRHVWVECNNKKYDIGSDVSYLLNPIIRKTYKSMKCELSESNNELNRIDLDNKDEILEEKLLVDAYNRYISDSSTYWNFDKKYLKQMDLSKNKIKETIELLKIHKTIKRYVDDECDRITVTISLRDI